MFCLLSWTFVSVWRTGDAWQMVPYKLFLAFLSIITLSPVKYVFLFLSLFSCCPFIIHSAIFYLRIWIGLCVSAYSYCVCSIVCLKLIAIYLFLAEKRVTQLVFFLLCCGRYFSMFWSHLSMRWLHNCAHIPCTCKCECAAESRYQFYL